MPSRVSWSRRPSRSPTPGRPDDVDAAETALRELISDVRETAAAGRAEAATALAHIDDPRFRALLVPLLYDHDPRVVQKRSAAPGKWGPLMACSFPDCSRCSVIAR